MGLAQAGFPAVRHQPGTCLPLLMGKDTAEPGTPKPPPRDPAAGKASEVRLVSSSWSLPWSQDSGTGLEKTRANAKKPASLLFPSHSENATARGRSSVLLKLGFIFTKPSPSGTQRQRQPCPTRGSTGRCRLRSDSSWGGQTLPRCLQAWSHHGSWAPPEGRGAVPPLPAAQPLLARLTPSSPLQKPGSGALPAV